MPFAGQYNEGRTFLDFVRITVAHFKCATTQFDKHNLQRF
jgi:hypothetical protein